MRLVLIPPYKNPAVRWDFTLLGFVASMQKKGQLKGIEVDVDEGYYFESTSEKRDEEVRANISVGIIQKVREYCEIGRHDAIVLTGASGDPGFMAARSISKIPVVGAVHSGIHFASLIGERFSILHAVASSSLVVKHFVESCGLGHKLASVRFCGHSSTYAYAFISQYAKEERTNVPEVKTIIDDITTQCVAAIENDMADSLIFVAEWLQVFEDEIRQRLNQTGYHEIPIICAVPAGIEMAKSMVNMKLLQTARAYPSHTLKAKPEYW